MKTEMGTHGGRSFLQKAGLVPLRAGFTLIEILVVVAIIAILAAIIIPAAGGALQAVKKRRAMVEMNSIKVAIQQFYNDHHYMPWPPEGAQKARVGEDKWALTIEEQSAVIGYLTTSNAMNKNYLQLPDKSRPEDGSDLFLDPWSPREMSKQSEWTFYAIGMDRNMDGAVTVAGSEVSEWEGKAIRERVLIFPLGDPETNPDKKLKTFDVTE